MACAEVRRSDLRRRRARPARPARARAPARLRVVRRVRRIDQDPPEGSPRAHSGAADGGLDLAALGRDADRDRRNHLEGVGHRVAAVATAAVSVGGVAAIVRLAPDTHAPDTHPRAVHARVAHAAPASPAAQVQSRAGAPARTATPAAGSLSRATHTAGAGRHVRFIRAHGYGWHRARFARHRPSTRRRHSSSALDGAGVRGRRKSRASANAGGRVVTTTK